MFVTINYITKVDKKITMISKSPPTINPFKAKQKITRGFSKYCYLLTRKHKIIKIKYFS